MFDFDRYYAVRVRTWRRQYNYLYPSVNGTLSLMFYWKPIDWRNIIIFDLPAGMENDSLTRERSRFRIPRTKPLQCGEQSEHHVVGSYRQLANRECSTPSLLVALIPRWISLQIAHQEGLEVIEKYAMFADRNFKQFWHVCLHIRWWFDICRFDHCGKRKVDYIRFDANLFRAENRVR